MASYNLVKKYFSLNYSPVMVRFGFKTALGADCPPLSDVVHYILLSLPRLKGGLFVCVILLVQAFLIMFPNQGTDIEELPKLKFKSFNDMLQV